MKFPLWRRRDEDLETEIRIHLEMATREREERGEAAGEAEQAARREFGNVALVKEVTREMWGWIWLRHFGQDLRYGIRMLRRSPGFTIVAVLSLALGIGANTAIFSVIDALMLRSLPVRSPRELVMFRVHSELKNSIRFSYPQFRKYRDRLPVFSGIVLSGEPIDRYNISVNGPDGGIDPAAAWLQAVSGNYFSVLGVDAIIGRPLTPDDDRVSGGHPVAVISYAYWGRRFGHSREVVGRTLTLLGTTYTILGVMPRGFTGERIGRATDLWIPASMGPQAIPEAPDFLTNPAGDWMQIVARLKPDVRIEQARAAADLAWRQAEMDTRPLTSEGLQNLAKQRLELDPFSHGLPGGSRNLFAQPLTILMTVVALVLLIACVNVASLLLARSSARQREIALRQALGASRARVVWQLLTESGLLAVSAGVLGLLVSVWVAGSAPLAMNLGPPLGTIRLDVQPDARMLGFSAALCLLVLLLFGLVPAFGASKVALTPALKGSGNSTRHPGGFRLGKSLVITQVALSLVLLVVAGLFVRTLRNLEACDPGLGRERLLLVWTRHGQTGLGRGPALATLYRTAQDRISSLPGVRSVSFSGHGLFRGGSDGSPIRVEGVTGESGKALWDYVEPRFLETLGIPLVRGRGFTDQDNTPTSPLVAIINETMARHYFGDTNPIGRRFGFAPKGALWEIVGVMKDSNLNSPRDGYRAEFYIPHREGKNLSGIIWLAIRTARDLPGLPGHIQSELRNIDSDLAVFKIDTLAEEIDQSLKQERLIAALSGLFSVLAVLLTCLGLYGVMSFTTARRTNEIGIRMALGATRAGVMGMVLKESFMLVVAGLAIGVPATLAATQIVSARLFGVSAADPLTIASAAGLMFAVAALAGFLPARRAARVDPMVALRDE